MRSGPETWTQTGDPLIEQTISRIIGAIVDELAARLSPAAIFATGSLAKGEVSARCCNGRATLLSDLEIAVVDRNWLLKRRLKRLERELSQRYEVELTLLFLLPRRFTRCVPANWAPAGSPLSIEQFELISTARCLFGRDLRKQAPPVRAEDIPVWEGVRLLFNRMAELAGTLCEKGAESGALGKALDKLLIACGDALLLSWRNYHPLYQGRLAALAGRFENDPGDSCGAARDDREPILGAYRAKLYGRPDATGAAAEPMAEALAVSDRVFRHVLGGQMGAALDEAAEVGAKYLAYPRLRQWARTAVPLANLVGLLRHLPGPLPVPLRRYFGGTYIGHEVYAAVHEWLYCEFRPQWQARGEASLDDEDLMQRGRRCVARWRNVCM